jgi:hypothetical protein
MGVSFSLPERCLSIDEVGCLESLPAALRSRRTVNWQFHTPRRRQPSISASIARFEAQTVASVILKPLPLPNCQLLRSGDMLVQRQRKTGRFMSTTTAADVTTRSANRVRFRFTFNFVMALLMTVITIYGFSQTIGESLIHPSISRPWRLGTL